MTTIPPEVTQMMGRLTPDDYKKLIAYMNQMMGSGNGGGAQMMGAQTRDVWTAAYVNNLPDSSFLLVEPGGRKDAEGKTVPRSLRHFPVKNAAGDVDEPHLANALARIPQASSISASQRAAAMDKAKAMAKGTNVSGPKGEYSGSAGSGRARPAKGFELRTVEFEFALELRADGDGRTLYGRAVPFGQTIILKDGDARERFMPGAFARQIGYGPDHLQRIKLYDSHDARMSGQLPIGKTVMLAEQPDGLHGAWPLYNTTKGNDALELVRSGEVTGLSIGFKPTAKPQIGPDGAYERTAVHLDHIVLTQEPAYADAQVTAVRTAPPPHRIDGFKVHQGRAHAIIDRMGLPL
jgi:HK97 family phage prohead protease